MLDKVNSRVRSIEVPGIRYFSNQVAQMSNGVNLTIGEPDFTTPENVKQAGIAAINKNLTGYSHNSGSFELRQEVSSFFKEKYNFYYRPQDEIIITNGASEGLDSVLRTILCDGDEVILPAPIYSAYESLIQLNGGKTIYLDTTDTGFKPDPERLESLITDKTKAIILNYPSNPTGVTLDKKVMDQLVDVLQKNNLFVIADEIYSENTFNKEHTSFASYIELRDTLFLVHGLSKSHAMTGWRVGFLLGPKSLIQQVLKVHLNNSICASLPSQYAAIEALKNNRNTPITMNKSYIERRDFMQECLQNLGFEVVSPSGAFYIFPSIKQFGQSAFDFATELLNTQRVAVVPGSSFSNYGEGYIRISYANSMEQLVDAMERLEVFVKGL
ncbi:aminotransferase class I/II-fold pyridoxal phosphate-dependent enzyme [Lentibacillus lipolyticus]|nr:aminotransferase class I/II-fold pyridoxal phosphate-dependent enzyme [Lentibacillus lipolyticus]